MDVFYRLYINHKDEPCVICVQWFDLPHYEADRFMNEEQYLTEEDAEKALLALKVELEMPLSNYDKLKIIRMLKATDYNL